MASEPFRVPRSRAHLTHASMREDITRALDSIVYGDLRGVHDLRDRFEAEFAAAVGQTHAVGVTSGTVGLFLALKACGIGPGDEVITVGNSDISTTAAVHHCGAVCVLCDVLESDYTLDTSRVAALISPRTKAILPVDLHGHPADVKALRALADAHGLLIVEDAALAVGAHDHGRPVGAFADAAVFSFAPFKPLGGAGTGAVVVTSDEAVAERLRLLVGYGHTPGATGRPVGHQHYIAEGYNVPLDTLQAAVLLVKLPHLPEWTARRQAIAQAYRRGLADTGVLTPTFRPESAPTFRSYCVRAPNQGSLYHQLREAGVEVVLHYTPPAYQHPVYTLPLAGSDRLAVTDQLATELICLPVSPELTDDDIAWTLDVIHAAL
ncbi:MAG: DegT/DnrJ/EryC1/StrS family aminotransferase [Pleurocapsa minor GSE-CHR-MK-17-07R]|jgi:dTDP-4-amino-4,6-dideoxygalactose transaminase|nr:DegT/DnrJ/EryC1/StrS family aminotransferase [Pleurocapsa minor GSE-CHR-MK 17-07R]